MKEKTGKESLYKYWLKAIMCLLFIIGVVVSCVLFSGWSSYSEASKFELSQLIIFCIVGIVTAIGFLIAAERQETFSDQVQGQVNQGF